MKTFRLMVQMVVDIEAPDGADAVEWVGETLEGENVGFEVVKLDIVGISEHD